MKTTEAQTKALVTLVYPRMYSTTSTARKNSKVKHVVRFPRPRSDVYSTLERLGLVTASWERRMVGNVERDIRVQYATAEGKKIARAYVRKLLAAKGVLLKGQVVQVYLTDSVGHTAGMPFWRQGFLFAGYAANDSCFVVHTTGLFAGCRVRHHIDNVAAGRR